MSKFLESVETKLETLSKQGWIAYSVSLEMDESILFLNGPKGQKLGITKSWEVANLETKTRLDMSFCDDIQDDAELAKDPRFGGLVKFASELGLDAKDLIESVATATAALEGLETRVTISYSDAFAA